ESLLYIRPLYLRAQSGRIPELTRVIVAYQNRIVMERTLEEGLSRLFGGATQPAAGPPAAAGPAAAEAPGAAPAAPAAGPDAAAMAEEARQAYQRAIDAQRAGDWATYGEQIKRLGELLERMRPR
ncbi:MAG: UPF0182 family protein, partial [Vicinamibacterales bacterium]